MRRAQCNQNRCVALALPGAQLAGSTVARREIHQLASEGVLCSAAELGLGDDGGQLLELERRVAPGTPLDQLLETDDHIFDLSVTPNRGDWLSMLGIAREIAAKCGLQLRRPAATRAKSYAPAMPPAHIDAAAQAVCLKFTCLSISAINATVPTPALIAQRLRRCGVRPVSIVVDLTNYVMLDIGQPLHAFDRSRLNGALHIRYARAGEKLELLDGTAATLNDRHLVVADGQQAQAIGGVMGGMHSAVFAHTTDILLEAAHFVPAVVRGRTRELNISSEAAFRFERGVDPSMCEIAIHRAARLIKQHCGGSVGALYVTGAAPPPPAAIELRHGQVEKLTGVAVPQATAAARLKALGCKVARASSALRVVSPSWRFDIERKEDLIEEVIRLGGYDALPTTMPQLTGSFAAVPTPALDAQLARDRLAQDGYQEIITYAFVQPQWELDFYANARPFCLANPLAEDLSAMRSGLLGGLLDKAIYNQRRRQTGLRLFEIGRCFDATANSQPLRIAALGWGKVGNELWDDQKRNYDFFDARGSLARLLPGIDLELAALTDHPALHPGRAAAVALAGQSIGIIGEIHPALLGKERYPLEPAPVVFELDLGMLQTRAHAFSHRPVGKLPLVRRDLAVLVSAATTAAQLVKSALQVKSYGNSEIAEVFVFDSYSGSNIASGKRSIGLRVVMQGSTVNLVESRINEVMTAITAQLQLDFQAETRSA